MLAQLFGAFARLEPVRIAHTDEERAAVFRMRYSVYINEKNAGYIEGRDDVRRELRFPEDDEPESTLFYVGTPQAMRGTLRVTTWAPGKIPADFVRRYSLDRFPDLGERAVCTVSALMAPPTLRGTAAVVALTSGAVERTVIEHKAELLIANCAPGLLRSYMRLGLRPYGAQPFQTYSGLQIPVAGVTADVDHLRRCGSPWAPVLRRLKQRGQLSARDFQPLLPPFADRSFDTNCDQVLAALNQVRARSPFLQLLSPKVMALLAQGGTLFRLQPDLDMIVKGYANRDVFLLIDGALEVRANEQRITTIQPGEVIGEIAFFHPSGQRTAAVRSIAPSQLIHIGHSHLRRMAKRHGLATVEVYEALARVAVDRLAASKAATS